jgi:purine-binding chemotaxis protein CheW
VGINWGEVRRRLEESGRALEQALRPDPEQIAAVYRRRAEQLARRRGLARSPAGAFAVLVFVLGSERYALPLTDLAGLFPQTACTPAPGGPPELLGIANVRGVLRSVVDLGRLLGLSPAQAGAGGYVLLVQKGGRQAALRVDRAEGTRLVRPQEMVPVASADAAAPRFVRGRSAEGLRLLDTEAVLAHPLFAG